MLGHLFESGVEPAAIDRVLAALAGSVRCRVPAYFEGRAEDAASLDELVEHVAVSRDDADGSARRVRARLHHVALPKLQAAGLLDYDVAAGVVRYRGTPPGAGVGADARFALVGGAEAA